MDKDPLEFLPKDKWPDACNAFKSTFPKGIPAYYALEIQRLWVNQELKHKFNVYCPFGDVWNGIVCFNQKDEFYEIIVQCPTTNTDKLEDALRRTKLIDWSKSIVLPFAPEHVVNCIKKVLQDVGSEIDLMIPSECFVIDNQRPLFDDVRLPETITFEHLSIDHVSVVNSKWPHRYQNSEWYFQFLINAKRGYGLFKNKELVAWVFVTEVGTIGHVYTLEDHRKNGYAELLLRLISNVILKDKKHVFGYCVIGNATAYKMYKKLGFQSLFEVAWCYLRSKKE